MFSIFTNKIDFDNYIIVKYNLEGKVSLRDAAWELAIGQSVGNPHIRNTWETDELFENFSCKIFFLAKHLFSAVDPLICHFFIGRRYEI